VVYRVCYRPASARFDYSGGACTGVRVCVIGAMKIKLHQPKEYKAMVTLTIIPLENTDIAHMCVADLERMYLRWAYNHDYRTKVARYPGSNGMAQFVPHDLNDDGIGGHLWTVVHIDVPHEWLQGENGVHHFRRVSPFDSSGKVLSCLVMVSVTWGEPTATKPIRSYDLVLDRATDKTTGQTATARCVLDGELLGVQREAQNV
jgi:protein subunit release factor A